MSRIIVPDLSEAIRTALVGSTTITSRLTAFKGSFPVFTKRPASEGAPYPMIMVSGDIAVEDMDGINDQQPVLTRDVSTYGQLAQYRVVDELARYVRLLFDLQRTSITVAGWHVTQIWARGPTPAPSEDDDKTVGRLVSLRIQLARPS